MSDQPAAGQPEFWLAQVAGSGNWYIFWYDSALRRTRRKSTGSADKALAQVALAQHILNHGKPQTVSRRDFQIAMALHRYNTKNANTPSGEFNSYAVPALIEQLGTLSVGGFNLERQEALVTAFRGKGWSDAYINRHITIVRAALNDVWKAELIDSVPFIAGIDEGEPAEKHVFTVDQLCGFLDEARAVEHLFRFCVLEINTLSRPCAILELGPRQVHYDHNFIRLNPEGRRQTKKFRPVVPITDTLRPWLRLWDATPVPLPGRARNVVEIATDLAATGLPYVHYHRAAIADIGKVFERVGVSAGLIDNPSDPPELHRSLVTPYCLRHTMATELAKRGVLKEERDRFMGHKIPGSGENYVHFEPQYLRAAKEAIDAYCELLPPLKRVRPAAGLRVVS